MSLGVWWVGEGRGALRFFLGEREDMDMSGWLYKEGTQKPGVYLEVIAYLF